MSSVIYLYVCELIGSTELKQIESDTVSNRFFSGKSSSPIITPKRLHAYYFVYQTIVIIIIILKSKILECRHQVAGAPHLAEPQMKCYRTDSLLQKHQ